jgi:hypothetical protein
MKVVTYEGVVENGQVRLPAGATLPEKAKVYVVVPEVPELGVQRVVNIASPRLVHPEEAPDFVKEVFEERSDAGL